MERHGFAFGDAYVRVNVTEPSVARAPLPTLYFLHGRFSDSTTWNPVIAKLPQYRCVSLDFPGFGHSFSMRERGFGVAEHVRLLGEVLKRVPASRSVLVGHDFGGGVAAMLAAQSPEKVAGLILLNSASPCEPLGAQVGWLGWTARWEVLRELRISKPRSLEVEALLLEPWYKGSTRKALVRALRALEQTWPEFHERQYWRQSLTRSERAALILWGGRDTIQSLERGIALSRVLPNSDFYVDPDSGHWPGLDNSSWVGARIREFMFRLGVEESAISDRKSLSR